MSAEVGITVTLRVYPSGEGTDLFLFDTLLRKDVLIGSFCETVDGSFRCFGEHIPEAQVCSCIDDAVELVVTSYLNKPREIEEGSPEEMEFYRALCEAPEPEESGKFALLMFVLAALYAWWWLR